jgi:hypothetical protein
MHDREDLPIAASVSAPWHPRSKPALALAIVVLAVLTLTNVYRAATQAIVYDEAATHLIFISGPISHVFTWYTANNHVLFTLLANATTEAFGASELTLRLPSVIAGTGYLLVVLIMAWRICQNRGRFLLTFCAVALNPLVFDFMSAARGYGMALFLLMLGLLTVSDQPSRSRWLLASLTLGGAVCANLAFAYPAIAVLVSASYLALRERPVLVSANLLLYLWLPGGLLAAAMLAVPLSHATLASFYFGAGTLSETASSLISLTVRHHPTWWTETAAAMWIERSLWFVAVAVVIGMLLAGVSALTGVRETPVLSSATRWRLLLGGTWATTMVMLVGTHVLAGVLYPKERTGLYLITLAILGLAVLGETSRHRGARIAVTTTLVLLTLTSVEQFTIRSYGSWRYDAGSRHIAEMIAAWPDRQGGTFKVAATQWGSQLALEFYRVTRFPGRLLPVSDGYDPVRADQFDFLVVHDSDTGPVGRWWQQVYRDPVSSTRLLANRRRLPVVTP